MVAVGEVRKYKAVAGRGIVIFFFRMRHVFVGSLRGQEAQCIVVTFLLSIFIQKNT
jgi:hypothetical protein